MLAINIVVSTQQYFYQGFTLIDITPTGITSYSAEHEFERNQQRNWETIQQIIGLRTEPNIIATSHFEDDVSKYNFGINYSGQQKIWSFKFSVSDLSIYQSGPDKFGLVKYDFALTPVLLGLTETVKPEYPLFYPKGPWNNIYFKSLID